MLSLEQQLLHSALLCGLEPGNGSAYRMQLFFVANCDLGSKSHQSDFQRAIETAVDVKGLFDNHEFRGSGEYVLTAKGFSEANDQLGNVQPKYEPKSKEDFLCTIRGFVEKVKVEISTRGTKSTVLVAGKKMPSAIEACRRIELLIGVNLPTQGESAVRVLQDFAIDRGFDIEFN